ncbi:MAG: hypothetical protein LBG90_01075 [Spirochaetaceae bacterium]|nr:hypothetical protein [Spirochaetaceae bacterium]
MNASLHPFFNRGYTISCPLENAPKVAGAQLSLPVSSPSYTYAQFKHVSGVPVPEELEELKGLRGVSISRLKIIDVLIEHLNSGEKADVASLDMDALVRQFKNATKQPYTPSKEVTGVIFDVEVS